MQEKENKEIEAKPVKITDFIKESNLKAQKTDMDYILIHRETVQPNGAVMLFHGLTGSPYELKKYAKFLYSIGFDVYCYCLPGHGSHNIDIYNVKEEDWRTFAENTYREIRPKYADFFVGGLCLGAVLALNLAEENKDITGLICLSTTLFLDGWTIPRYKFLMPMGLHTILKYYYTFPEREPFGIKNEKVRNTISKLMKKNTVAMDNYPLSSIYELLALSKRVRQNIKKVFAPILIIHSLEDDLTSTKSAKFTYNNVSSFYKEYMELKDSYHLILYDNEKEKVYNKTTEFINALSYKRNITLKELQNKKK